MQQTAVRKQINRGLYVKGSIMKFTVLSKGGRKTWWWWEGWDEKGFFEKCSLLPCLSQQYFNILEVHSNCAFKLHYKVIPQKIYLGQNKNKYTSTSKQKEQCVAAHLESQEVLPLHRSHLVIQFRFTPMCQQFLAVPSDTL